MSSVGRSAPVAFDDTLRGVELFPLMAKGVETFQVNLGRLCNLSCRHCHVKAGPMRAEVMDEATIGHCIAAIDASRCRTVDVTGGSPEMNPGYRSFIEEAGRLSPNVMTRTNLAILTEAGYGDLPRFWAGHGVEVVASLPFYHENAADKVRGKGVFAASIKALKKLNDAGYGREGGGVLNLVYNPAGAVLPKSQKGIEADFRRVLGERHGISFNGLFALANMPLGRFSDRLRSSGGLGRYMTSLASSFNPGAAELVMCRTTVSVGWDGSLFDCDFNQAAGLRCGYGAPAHVRDFDPVLIAGRRIVTAPHCYGCTAGAGSSCTGEVV